MYTLKLHYWGIIFYFVEFHADIVNFTAFVRNALCTNATRYRPRAFVHNALCTNAGRVTFSIVLTINFCTMLPILTFKESRRY